MPSQFFNQLVQARRDGTAPTQSAPPTAGAGETSNAGTETSPAPEVTFRPPSPGVPLACSGCGALVDAGAAPAHVQWHREQST